MLQRAAVGRALLPVDQWLGEHVLSLNTLAVWQLRLDIYSLATTLEEHDSKVP